MPYARYAIYFTPPPGALAQFGAAWLGWDMATGDRPKAPDVTGLPAPAHDLSEKPSRYGFHATMKPPFHLAEGETVKALDIALRAFCGHASPVALDGLSLTQIGRFLALVPEGDDGALRALAADVVREFDPFRAQPSDDEMEWRRGPSLTKRQQENLDAWGYPYVMDDFRFHMTLTGPLPKQVAEVARAALESHITPILPRPFVIDALTLCGQDHESGTFHSLARYPLAG
ncbi:DUF1045 domain-containing protein [Tropicibacter sp. S64]|uniref:DUF1045 domain-containing protein n=1 Tax=Tropicibacter sp. S64 TaxID=3415122 RepID=UPI003C7C57A2